MWGQKLGKPVKSKTFEGRRIGNISYSEHFFLKFCYFIRKYIGIMHE